MASSGNVGIGMTNPGKTLDVTGTARVSGAATLSNTLAVSGASTLKGAVAISGAATVGTTLGVTGATTLTGGVSVGTAASLSFGSITRQMINLWGTGYAIGVQSRTTYFRSDYNFAFYEGGSHSDRTRSGLEWDFAHGDSEGHRQRRHRDF